MKVNRTLFARGGRSLLCLSALLFPLRSPAASSDKPNIVFILVDDVAMGWYGCYGSNFKTPNIDRLAAQGTRFSNAWAAPMCSPSRVEFLTGQYPFRSGWTSHCDVPRWGGSGLSPERFTTITQVMKRDGYATAISGKWQLNDLRSDQQIMKKFGFDEYCLWPGGEVGNPPSNRRYWDAFLEINGDRRSYTGQFGPEINQKFALSFIEKHKGDPFYLYYPMMAAHSPLEPLPDAEGGKSAQTPTPAELVAAYIAYIDRQVGELTAKIDELGLAAKTVIVLAGDNGSGVGVAGTLNGHPLPEGKGKVTDLGVHVPLIISAPMLKKHAGVVTAPVDFTDLYPTFIELAGGTLPKGVAFDGRSLVPLLKGDASEAKPWIYSQLGDSRIIRDARWLISNSGSFFDLQNDPLQKQDLQASTEPEVVAARERLGKVMASLPPDGPAPFDGYSKIVQVHERKRKGKTPEKPQNAGAAID